MLHLGTLFFITMIYVGSGFSQLTLISKAGLKVSIEMMKAAEHTFK